MNNAITANAKRCALGFGSMVLFRGGAKRALALVLDVFLSLFSLLINYCATRVSLWFGFFLWKQKPFLWAVRAGGWQ
jgi:hypothetical protein